MSARSEVIKVRTTSKACGYSPKIRTASCWACALNLVYFCGVHSSIRVCVGTVSYFQKDLSETRGALHRVEGAT